MDMCTYIIGPHANSNVVMRGYLEICVHDLIHYVGRVGGWVGGNGPVLGRLGYELTTLQLQNGAHCK